ncbi:MAG: lecithin retinol acyltransferase family protein [Aureispira sp.]
MPTLNLNKLKIGDRLVRTKGGIFSKHHVLYAGFWNNQHLIAENQNGFGVRYYLLSDFLNEGTLNKIEHYNFSENAQAIVLDRINKKIGTAYNLTAYNCEHFVNEILNGVAESKQVKNAVAIGIGVSLSLFAIALLSGEHE